MKIFPLFIQALTWNAAGALLYKFLLLAYQYFLFQTISTELYGKVGTIFSGIFFLISITNFGFEYTFFPLFEKLSNSKKHAALFFQYCYIRIFISMLVGGAFLLCAYYIPYVFGFLQPIIQSIPHSLLLICAGIIIAESIKKSCIVIMQLSFQNKISSSLEVGSLLLYIGIICFYYYWYQIITISILLKTLFITTILETFGCIFYIKSWYNSLPEGKNPLEFPKNIIFHEQLYNYINQLIKAIFSPNFLLLLASMQLGFYKVGIVKLLTEVIGFLYMFFHKTVALAAGATFIHLHKDKNQAIPALFSQITTIYSIIVQLLVWSCCILQYFLQSYEFPEQNFVIFMILFISMLEYMMLPYEKLFITKSAAKALMLCNILSILTYCIIIKSGYISSIFILPILFFIRYVTFISYALYIKKYWHIQTNVQVWIPIHIAALIIALFSYFKGFFA